MKNITQVIKLLKGIKKNGGDISTFNLSAGVREIQPGEKDFSQRDYVMGFTQHKRDGTFSLSVQGTFEKHERHTTTKK